MAQPYPQTLGLACHPLTPTDIVSSVEVRLRAKRAGAIALSFTLEADLARLRIPSITDAHCAERLWEHTCFEVFVTVNDSSAYCEFNFSPSGEWAAYVFRRYRDGEPLMQTGMSPEIYVHRAGNKLELNALLCLERLPSFELRSRPRLALAAVIEDERGVLSYWALRHPSDKPDFHHPDAFALTIEPLNTHGAEDLPYARRL